MVLLHMHRAQWRVPVCRELRDHAGKLEMVSDMLNKYVLGSDEKYVCGRCFPASSQRY